MCKVLYINCESGMSGDMFLGALVSMGVPPEHLQSRLALLGVSEFDLTFGQREVGGVSATDVDVLLHCEKDLMIDPYSGDYRTYKDIKEMIAASGLSESEKSLSLKIFEIKAEAESWAHDVAKDEVKFHEKGAVDSIVDIVGAAICIDYIKADKVISKPVPTGYGEVICACGTLKVPVPAVKQILRNTGIPSYRSDIEQEILTPTGASIVAGIADAFSGDAPSGMTIGRGYGTGKRKTGLPPLEVTLCDCITDNN